MICTWYNQGMKYLDYLKTMVDCPFCSPTQRIVTENEFAFLTYSLAPYRSDHLLVVPKVHVEHVIDLTDEIMSGLNLLQKVGLRMLNKLGHPNVSLLVRDGMGSGKSIPHLHYHLIPDILLGDIEHNGKERDVLSEEKTDLVINRLCSVL